MPTNKPRITAYVKQEVFDKFDEFCKQSDVKHSKGIEQILSKFFSGDTPSTLLSNTISDEALNARIDERLASVTHQSDTGNALIEAISARSASRCEERLDDEVKKLAEVLNRMTLLEEKMSDLKSNTNNTIKDLVTQDQLAELKDTIAANQNAIAQIQQNKQLKLNFEPTQLDKTLATTAAPEQKTEGNSSENAIAPLVKEISSTPPAKSDETSEKLSLKIGQRVTKKEAHEYALKYYPDCPKKTTTFGQRFSDHPNKNKFGFKKGEKRGEYILTGKHDN